MEKAPNMSTMSFGSLEEEAKYKRLMRLVKQAPKGRRSSNETNDFENAEVSLSISSIAPESPFLQTRQLLETSKTGSYVIASSNNPGRMHHDRPIGKEGGHRQPLAMSSVKGYSKSRKETVCPTDNSLLPGQIQRHDRAKEISNGSTYSKKQASISNSPSYQLSSYGKSTSKYSQRGVGARFAYWTIMLNEQNKLVIEGNLIGGSYCRSKPVLMKVSRKMVETTNKCLYTLVGNISDENDELPSYVREKFYDGFPDDWENVYQLWLSFIHQGCPRNFHWPTDLADSDDDLRSELTDDTVECHLANFPQSSHEFSQKKADSALSRESLQLPTTTNPVSPTSPTSPTSTFESRGIIGQRSNENEKEAGINESEKRTAVANLGAKSIDFNCDKPENNQAVDICEEIDVLYKKFLNLFDRLRLAYSKRDNTTILHSSQEASSPEKMRLVKENNGSKEPAKNAGSGARREEWATSPMPMVVPKPIAIERKDYQSAARPTAKISANSDESESEMYAGVRKMPVGIILSEWNRRHISDGRKRSTLTRRKSRDSYVRRTRRIRSVNSSRISESEEKEESEREDEGAFALQNEYEEEKANAYRRSMLTRMPLSHIDSGMNVQLNTSQFNKHQTLKSNLTKAHLPGQRSMSKPSQCASVRSETRNIPAPLYSAVNTRKKDEGSLENFYSSCTQLTSTTTSETIGRAPKIPAATGQHLIPEDQLTHRRTDAAATTTLETTSKSSQAILEKSPAERNRPVTRISKSNDSNVNAKGNSAAQQEELEAEAKEKETLETAHPSSERIKKQVTAVQLLKSWLPRVVRKSTSDLDGELIFHGQLINSAGHLLRKSVTTSSVRRRLSRSLIETVDSQVYELVGEMFDPKNTVPKHLLTQCRYGCPSRIEDFCKAWLAVSLPNIKDNMSVTTPQRAHDATMERLNVSVSSKGRRILPPLSYWTGERVLLKDNNPVYSPGIVADTKVEEKKSPGGATSSDRHGSSAKRTLSTSGDSNDDSTHPNPPSGKKRRKTETNRGGAAESFKFSAMTTRRSKQTNPTHRSGMEQQPPHHRSRTVKPNRSDQEELDDASSPVQTAAPVEKLQKARGRLTRGNSRRQEQFNATEKNHAKPISSPEDTRRQVFPSLNSSTGKRRKEKVSYNLYKNCPSEEDALSDDRLSHV